MDFTLCVFHQRCLQRVGERERDSFAKKIVNNHLLCVRFNNERNEKEKAATQRVKTDFFYYYIYFMEGTVENIDS